MLFLKNLLKLLLSFAPRTCYFYYSRPHIRANILYSVSIGIIFHSGARGNWGDFEAPHGFGSVGEGGLEW